MENRWSIIIAIILAVGLIATLLVKPSIVTVNPSAEKNTLDVSADGTVSADPDIADIYVTVETKADTAQKAQEDNAAIVNSLQLALRGTALTDEVTTDYFSLYPNYQYDYDTGRSSTSGFVATHSLKIHTSKVVAVGKLLDVATTNGATSIGNVQFGLSDSKQESLKEQALESAVAKAKTKAKLLAGASGIALGKIVDVTESSYLQPPIYYAAADKAMAGSSTQITPGQVEVTATVSLSYEIN